MSDIATKPTETLLEKGSVDEVFRSFPEEAINDLLQTELQAFPGYEKYDSAGWNSGNNINGSYDREFDTKYGKLKLKILRDREGNFEQQLIP